uniref:Chromosome 16 open reading frame 90 n=1 Tax=Monodon monoceros TaxID=40151 RepID=A0A8C6B5Q6_MONMO
MEALVCAFSQLHIREDAVSWARGRTSHPNMPPNIYVGGLGAQQQQCPSAQGSKPKNLHHLRGLALYLPSHMHSAGQCESHWLSQLMAGGCLPQPEGTVLPLDLPQGALGPGNSHHSALLEADSLGNTASSSSMDPAKGAPSQPGAPEGLGLRPKRSWGASEESTCPLSKRTHSGALERP